MAEEYRMAQFATALTELSRQYGLGIAGRPELFVMESDRDCDDFTRSYRIDAEGRLLFD
jgi:hypothetical protein